MRTRAKAKGASTTGRGVITVYTLGITTSYGNEPHEAHSRSSYSAFIALSPGHVRLFRAKTGGIPSSDALRPQRGGASHNSYAQRPWCGCACPVTAALTSGRSPTVQAMQRRCGAVARSRGLRPFCFAVSIRGGTTDAAWMIASGVVSNVSAHAVTRALPIPP